MLSEHLVNLMLRPSRSLKRLCLPRLGLKVPAYDGIIRSESAAKGHVVSCRASAKTLGASLVAG